MPTPDSELHDRYQRVLEAAGYVVFKNDTEFLIAAEEWAEFESGEFVRLSTFDWTEEAQASGWVDPECDSDWVNIADERIVARDTRDITNYHDDNGHTGSVQFCLEFPCNPL